MEHLEWNALLDKYILTQTMSADDYERLNEYQMFTIQELKKSFKRIAYKNNNG